MYVWWFPQWVRDCGYKLGSTLPIAIIILNNRCDIDLGHGFETQQQQQFIWNIINISPWLQKITIVKITMSLL